MKAQRSVLLGLALSVGLFAACTEEGDVIIPDPPLEISVTPTTVPLEIDGSAQITASVTGGEQGGDKTVAWTTSDAGIASITPNGNTVTVTGEGAGTATITARANADNNVSGSATVTVTLGAGPPTISIQRITTFVPGVGDVDVNLNSVNGQINIIANVEVPSGTQVQRVEFLVDQTIVCAPGFQTSPADASADEALAPVSCLLNTAAFSAAGVPNFFNGPHTLLVRVIGPGGDILAQSSDPQFQTLVFNNASMLVIESPTTDVGSATDNAGLIWNSGDLIVSVLPVLFNQGGALTSVTVSLTAAGTATPAIKAQTITSATAGKYVADFSDNDDDFDEVGDVEQTLGIVATSVTSGGQQGPQGTLGTTNAAEPAIRLDNEGPTITGGAIAIPAAQDGWVGPNVTTASLVSSVTTTDNGVGKVVKSVQWKLASANTSAFATVASFSELDETQTNDGIDLRGRACDALNNCTNDGTVDAGVDKTAPTNVTYGASPAHMAIIAAVPTSFELTGADALSGPFDFFGTLRRLNPSGSTSCVVGSGGGCNSVSSLTNVFDVTGTDGYWTFAAIFRDQALNTTAPDPTSRTVVRDVTPPAVANVNVPVPAAVGGQSATFTAVGTDNLDLRDQLFRTVYTDGTELPYALPQMIGEFGSPLLQQTNLTATVSLIRSVEFTTLLHAPSAVVSNVSSARFLVRDFGLNPATATGDLSAVADGNGAAGLGVNEFEGQVAAGSPVVICDPDDPPCGNTPTSTQVVGMARGESGTFAAPFAKIVFYVDLGGGLHHFIGESTTRSSTDNGVMGDPIGRVWTYGPVTFSGAGFMGQVVNIVAVGVDSNGDALISQVFTVTVN